MYQSTESDKPILEDIAYMIIDGGPSLGKGEFFRARFVR
jgi:hypothetical protein